VDSAGKPPPRRAPARPAAGSRSGSAETGAGAAVASRAALTAAVMAVNPWVRSVCGCMPHGLRKPKDSVPGFDVAGRIAAVGSNVTHTQPGDEVFGWCDGSLRVLDMLNGSWARLIRAGVRTFGMA